ncbi:MAG: exodeoxyribonuclease VII large subunit [Planctomycetota bacterium]
MSGRVELDGDRLKITFPYREDLVQVVRGFEGRAWDKERRAWYVPRTLASRVVEALRGHQFLIDDNVAALCDGAPSVAVRTVAPEPAAEPQALTISQLNMQAREALVRAFPGAVWVVGEIVGFDRNRHKRNVYFELAEKDAAAEHHRATVSAVLFEQEARLLEARWLAAQVPFTWRDGLEVRVLVRVDLWGPSGSYQVIIQDVDPVHTLGRLAMAREAVLAELARRGIQRRNAALELPPVPLRVGLITSHGSDAYNDFVNELQRSGFTFEITAHDCLMQGRDFKRSMLRALAYFAERATCFDVLAIVRGGGARTDLAWFDDLEVAIAVALAPVKVISGIGHGVSVIDLITHSEKTPTAAAQLLVRCTAQAVERIERSWQEIAAQASSLLIGQRERVTRAAAGFEHSVTSALARASESLAGRRRRLVGLSGLRCRHARRATVELLTRLVTGARACARAARRDLARSLARLAPDKLERSCERAALRLAELDRRRQLLDPVRLLARGYAMVFRRGTIVTRAAQVEPGDELAVRMQDGELTTSVLARTAQAKGPADGGAEPRV